MVLKKKVNFIHIASNIHSFKIEIDNNNESVIIGYILSF